MKPQAEKLPRPGAEIKPGKFGSPMPKTLANGFTIANGNDYTTSKRPMRRTHLSPASLTSIVGSLNVAFNDRVFFGVFHVVFQRQIFEGRLCERRLYERRLCEGRLFERRLFEGRLLGDSRRPLRSWARPTCLVQGTLRLTHA
jgi:hypothetical protein